MWRCIAIAGKRNSHTLVKGNPQTAFALCGVCCWKRAFASRNGKLEDSKSDDAIDLFSQVVKSCPFPSTVEAFSRVPDYREILRNGLSDLKLDDAIGLFGEMVQSRPVPSIIDFNKLLSAIAKMKKFAVVISLGEQMQNLGISHDLYTYSILINCFCRSSQLSLALAVLGKMLKLGYEPSIVTLNSLLNGYCHCNRISDAVALLDQMEDLGYEPDTVTFTSLIHGLFRNNRASEALSLAHEMGKKGPCQPDLFTYGVLLNGLCKSGDIDLALNLLKGMEARNIMIDVVIYNRVIDSLCKYRHENDAAYNMLIQIADALFRKMKEKGPLPDYATYNMLIRAHLRDRDRAASAELIKEMRSCGFAGDASTIGLVTNMLYDGRLDKSFLDMFS